MRKHAKNLLFYIAAFMFAVVLFGSASIRSKAATEMKPVQNLKIVNDEIHFKATTDGYYAILKCFVDEKGVRKYLTPYVTNIGKLSANQPYEKSDVAGFIDFNELGQVQYYIVGSISPITNYDLTTLEGYAKNKPDYAMTSTSVKLTKRMDKPTGVVAKFDTYQGQKAVRLTWKNDGYAHLIEIFGEIKNYQTPSKNICDVFLTNYGTEIYLRTASAKFDEYANSEPVVINIAELEKNGIFDSEAKQPAAEDQSKQLNTPAEDPNAEKTVTVDDITYVIKDGKATATKIASKKTAKLDTVTVEDKTYPVVEIAANACKNNKKITTVTIGKNVTKIGKNAFNGCKKLKKVTITASSSLKVEKGAFKKINKKANIKVKGVKGKAKKKLVAAIKKQTNAKVK